MSTRDSPSDTRSLVICSISYRRAVTASANCRALPGRPSTFTDPRLCAAIVDRLTFDAHIIQTGTDSYRLRTAKARHQART